MPDGSGFLGTHASRISDVTLILVLIVIGVFTSGFVLARQRNLLVHRAIQTSAFITILIVALSMMVLPFRDYVLNDVGGRARITSM